MNLFKRQKYFVAIYEYMTEDGKLHTAFALKKATKKPEVNEFILRREPTGKIIIFEAKITYWRF